VWRMVENHLLAAADDRLYPVMVGVHSE
jgi:hypothetical protein